MGHLAISRSRGSADSARRGRRLSGGSCHRWNGSFRIAPDQCGQPCLVRGGGARRHSQPVLGRCGDCAARQVRCRMGNPGGPALGFVREEQLRQPGRLRFPAPEFVWYTSGSVSRPGSPGKKPGGHSDRIVASAGAISVSVTATGGTLVNGTDYTYASPTTVSFANNVTTASTQIPLSTNSAGTIILGLSNPTNFSRLSESNTSATVNIAAAVGSLPSAARP